MKPFKVFLILLLSMIAFFPALETEAHSGAAYEVEAGILHVRAEPSADAQILGVLHRGDKLTVFQEKYGWVQTYYAGEIAWVAKHYLVPDKLETATSSSSISQAATNSSVTVQAPSVNIRSGPSQDYQVVAGTKQGESFTVIDSSGDWLKVSLGNGRTGWIASWLTSGSKGAKTSTTNEQIAEASTAHTPSSTSLAGYTIALDAGHGGRDPGAIGLGGVQEKDLVSATTSKIASALRMYGATVIETRSSDYYVGLEERAYISNAHSADAFISVHYNSFPVVSVQGIQTFYYGDRSAALAKHIHSNILAAVPLASRGTAQTDFKVLRNTNAPAILLELGFITNPYDISTIQTADYQYNVADAIAKGFMQYFH